MIVDTQGRDRAGAPAPATPTAQQGLSIGSQSARLINNVMGNQSNYIDSRIAIPGPGGFAKALLALGVALYLAGFASFGYFVVSFMVWVFGKLQSQSSDSSGMPSIVPWVPLGVGLVFAATVVALIAAFFWKSKKASTSS